MLNGIGVKVTDSGDGPHVLDWDCFDRCKCVAFVHAIVYRRVCMQNKFSEAQALQKQIVQCISTQNTGLSDARWGGCGW